MQISMKNLFHNSILVLAFCVLLFFSTFHLSESPAIWYDEGFFTQMAMNFSEQGRQVLQVAPGEFVSGSESTAGFPLIAPVSISYTLFGVGVVQGRSIMVIFLLLFGIVAYTFTRLLFGAGFASWSLLLVVSLPMLYGNGKSVLGEVPGLVYLLSFLTFLVVLQKRNFKPLWLWALAGAAAGLCVTTKPIFLLLGFAVLLVWMFRFKEVALTWPRFFIGLASFLVPLSLWFVFQFGTADSLSQVLAFYANPYESTSLAHLLVENVRRFFTELTPAYTFVALVVWGISLYVRDKEKRISIAELVIFTFSTLVLIAFLRLPGWYRYLFPALIPALLFAPYAGVSLFTRLVRAFRFPPRTLFWVPYTVLALLIGVQLYQVAFHSYVADYYDGKRTVETQSVLASLPDSKSVFFYNVPEIVILLPHRNYYQYIAPHPENLIGEEQLVRLKNGEVDTVIATRALYEKAPENFFGYSDIESIGHYVVLRQSTR